MEGVSSLGFIYSLPVDKINKSQNYCISGMEGEKDWEKEGRKGKGEGYADIILILITRKNK